MQLKTWHRLLAVLLSVVLLSLGWWGASGLTMLVALVPNLFMALKYGLWPNALVAVIGIWLEVYMVKGLISIINKKKKLENDGNLYE